jgi:hypothetical protein
MMIMAGVINASESETNSYERKTQVFRHNEGEVQVFFKPIASLGTTQVYGQTIIVLLKPPKLSSRIDVKHHCLY